MATDTKKTSTPVLKLKRTGETCKRSGNAATGKRGKLTVGGKTFDTIERADGYVSLPAGTYTCKTGRRGSNNKPCIQIWHNVKTKSGSTAGIVVHAANWPQHLQGCIAPGKKTSGGVSSSEKTLKEIFELIGASDKKFGHKDTVKVRCKLVVSNAA